jgi:putative hydrolase of the HAD superfamily
MIMALLSQRGGAVLIRAVIIDFGGVLLRTEDQSPRQQLAARLGLTREKLYYQIFESESAHQATLGKISAQAHWESVRLAFGVAEDDFNEIREEFWAGDRLDEKLIGYLRILHSHYKVALLSNAWDDLRTFLQVSWNISDVFDELIISAEVGIAKPAPGIFSIAIDRLGIMPEESVFVDDSISNIESAIAFGMQAIHFQGQQQLFDDLALMLDSG